MHKANLMTEDVTWIDFQIVGKSTYQRNEPIVFSGELISTMDAPVHIYIYYKDSNGDWEEPPYTHNIPTIFASKDDHTNNRTFNSSIQLNNFYPIGNYKLEAMYSETSCSIEPEFEIIA
ncbi:hypothetical protein [Candidatus Nitrosotalea okcheonensis]|uniref:Uncharacterized protein n=1 Tax=Candidatus Nitrosotalea okcheonensis TaxID=1903276 RepID=A0A2H1FC63_9ARCH|nr:hypothetical protein [Candidatus Nitrosotalea okcheonensis]SMH70354.1 protein of unknown function [Candidatus Nitrosotalea okcheonensis]